MQKALADMTLQELWNLFPVILTPHNPQWKHGPPPRQNICQRFSRIFHP